MLRYPTIIMPIRLRFSWERNNKSDFSLILWILRKIENNRNPRIRRFKDIPLPDLRQFLCTIFKVCHPLGIGMSSPMERCYNEPLCSNCPQSVNKSWINKQMKHEQLKRIKIFWSHSMLLTTIPFRYFQEDLILIGPMCTWSRSLGRLSTLMKPCEDPVKTVNIVNAGDPS